jgi:hypothetical protein
LLSAWELSLSWFRGDSHFCCNEGGPTSVLQARARFRSRFNLHALGSPCLSPNVVQKNTDPEMSKRDYEREEVWYSVWGEKFFPSRLRLRGKVRIVRANDPGDIAVTGRYRGKPTPYGSCNVECTIKGRGKIAYLARHLAKHRRYYTVQHVSHIVFWILWRGVQGNTELSVNEVARLAETKVPVAMDYMLMEE